MQEEKWVIKTNQNRYVTIPFMLSSGLKSYLNESPTEKDTRRYHTEEEALEYLEKYLSGSCYYIDKYSFKDNECLDSVEKFVVEKYKRGDK